MLPRIVRSVVLTLRPRVVSARSIALGVGVLLALGCARSNEADSGRVRPYGIELLETESCPLPAGVDGTRVRILGARVRISASRDGIPANYFYASLLTQDESRYLAEHGGCSPVLSGAPLRANEMREGYLNFPVPLEKSPSALVYAPLVHGVSEREALTSVSLGPRDTDTSGDEER